MEDKTIAGSKRAIRLAAVRANPDKQQRLTGQLALVRTWIDRRLWQDEPDVQEFAWAQYRYMTPLERTELFTRLYFDAYIKAYAKHFPTEDANKKRPVHPELVKNDIGVINALWRARAWADVTGNPYDRFVDAVMEGHLGNDGWKRPPRPNQMYGKLSRPRVGELTPDELDSRIYQPDWDPRFFANAYCGHPAQEAAIALLQKIVAAAPDPDATLYRYLCERQAITVERAQEAFGDELVKAALSFGPALPVHKDAVTAGFYLLACIGHLNPSPDAPCPTCPINAQCLMMSKVVREELVRTTGSDDPRKQWKKQAGAERQRRYRERQATDSVARNLDSLLGQETPERGSVDEPGAA